ELRRLRLGRRLHAGCGVRTDNRLRAREAGIHAYHGDAVRPQLVGERRDEPRRPRLREVVRQVAEVLVRIVPAAGQDDQAALLLEQKRRREPRGRQLHPQARLEHRVPARQRLLPERRAEGLPVVVLVAAPRVRDDDVEPARLLANAREQRFDLRVVAVVDAHADPAAAALAHRSGGLVNGCAAGDVHGRAGIAQCERDSLADAAARAGDERNGASELRRLPAHAISSANRSAPTLPPERTMPTDGASTSPFRKAAMPTAPLGSSTSFSRSNAKRIASTICSSVTVTISSTSRLPISHVSAPGACVWRPSAIVRGTSIPTISPRANDCAQSSPAAGSTPTTRVTPSAFAIVAQPLISPPPPTGVTSVCTTPASSISS